MIDLKKIAACAITLATLSTPALAFDLPSGYYSKPGTGLLKIENMGELITVTDIKRNIVYNLRIGGEAGSEQAFPQEFTDARLYDHPEAKAARRNLIGIAVRDAKKSDENTISGTGIAIFRLQSAGITAAAKVEAELKVESTYCEYWEEVRREYTRWERRSVPCAEVTVNNPRVVGVDSPLPNVINQAIALAMDGTISLFGTGRDVEGRKYSANLVNAGVVSPH